EIAAATAAAEVASVAVAEVPAAVRLTLAHAFLELSTLFRAHRRHALFHALATLFALLGRHVGEVAASAAAEGTPALVGARLSIGALARRVLLLRVLRGLRIGPLPRVRLAGRLSRRRGSAARRGGRSRRRGCRLAGRAGLTRLAARTAGVLAP